MIFKFAEKHVFIFSVGTSALPVQLIVGIDSEKSCFFSGTHVLPNGFGTSLGVRFFKSMASSPRIPDSFNSYTHQYRIQSFCHRIYRSDDPEGEFSDESNNLKFLSTLL